MWRSIRGDIFFTSCAYIFEKGIVFILFICIANELGPYAYGNFMTSFVFVNLAFIFGELGLSMFTNREVARYHAKAELYLSNMLGLRVVSIVVITLSIIMLLKVIGYSYEVTKGIYIFIIYFALMYLSHAPIAVFYGFSRIKLVASIMFISKLSFVVVALVVLFVLYDLPLVQTSFIIGGGLQLLLSLFFVKYIVSRIRPAFDIHEWIKILKTALPLGLYMILQLLFFRVDTLLLTYFGYKSSEVGIYNAAYNVYAVLALPALAFSQVIFPKISHMFVHSPGDIRKHFFNCIFVLVGIGGIICIMSFFCASQIVMLLYGNDYMAAIVILKVLSIGVFFSFLSLFFQRCFIAIDRIRELIVLMTVAVFLNIILNAFMIPSMGGLGASYATVASEVVLVIFGFILMRYHIEKNHTVSSVPLETPGD